MNEKRLKDLLEFLNLSKEELEYIDAPMSDDIENPNEIYGVIVPCGTAPKKAYISNDPIVSADDDNLNEFDDSTFPLDVYYLSEIENEETLAIVKETRSLSGDWSAKMIVGIIQ